MKRATLILILVLLAGAFVRFYNFPARLIFGPEQGISLITSAEYISKKFSLLGQLDLIRDTSKHHIIFSGSLFNYSLVPLQLIFNYAPYPITIFFALLNLITGLILYLLTKKRLGFKTAIFALIFFLFNCRMIQHSLFIWIYNYTPLVFLFSLFLFWDYAKKPNSKNAFLIGLLSGIGFNLLYPYLFIGFIYFLLIFLTRSKNKITRLSLFLLGAIIGNLPMVIFDLKHQFYHLNTLFQYVQDALSLPGKSQITYYHFLPLYPLYALFLAIVVRLIYKKSKPIALLAIIIYLFINLNSPVNNFHHSTGMLPGITLKTFETLSETIATDSPPAKFNVAVLLDFDTRAHPLRYLLTYRYQFEPAGVTEYQNLDALYVFLPKDYDLNKPQVWELQVYHPYQIKNLPSPHPDYQLCKLTK